MKLILAVSNNGGIAKDGKLPWSIPEELSFFKQMTIDNVIIMGRKTFDSIGKLLPKRENIIVGKEYTSLQDAIKLALQRENENKTVWVIGGSEIAEAFKPYITEAFLSLIHDTFECDLFAPEFVINSVKTINRIYHKKENDLSNDTCSPIVYHKSEKFTVYRCFYKINYEEQNFQSLIRRISTEGISHSDRTGNGTTSIFGHQLTFSLENNKFPMSTLRKCFFKGIFEELMWFLRGQTDSNILSSKGVKIWEGNSSRKALDSIGLNNLREGDCGPIYGFQWRHWGAKYENCETDYEGKGIDQISNLIKEIKSNPYSRRLLISGWNVQDLNEMCLPPCHTFYQFEVSPSNDNGPDYLSCHYYQRSSDILLAGHWNITSASLLTLLLSHFCGLRPKKLIVSYGNVHIYNSHKDTIKEHLKRCPFEYPTLVINSSQKDYITQYEFTDLKLENYNSHPQIVLDMIV